jgi:hypothetical protein
VLQADGENEVKGERKLLPGGMALVLTMTDGSSRQIFLSAKISSWHVKRRRPAEETAGAALLDDARNLLIDDCGCRFGDRVVLCYRAPIWQESFV